MPTVKIDSFSGIMPMVHPTMLPDGCAVKAFNCSLKSGKLSPLRMPSQVTDINIRMENGLTGISGAKSIFLWRKGISKEFLAWPGVVTVAPSNISDDSMFRIFVTGETGIGGAGNNRPCVYSASSAGNAIIRHDLYKALMPAPSVTRNSALTDTENTRYTFFFQTWVDAFGYESGASVASQEVEYNDGQDVTVALSSAPEGAEKRRIYKVVSGTATEQIQFIFEQDRVNQWFPQIVVAIKDEDAGEVLPKIVSIPDDLVWMAYVPGNYYVGFSASNRRTVMFSDLDRPTSWPDFYSTDVRDDLVGVAVCGNTVYGITTGYPWAITGTSPDGMSGSVIASQQGCVSDRSICVMDGRAFYVSADGICVLSPDSAMATVITDKFFSKDEWLALNPSSCIMIPYDGALLAWFELDDGTKLSYIFNLKEGTSAITTHDEYAKSACVDTVDDALYFVRGITS